MRSQGGLLSPYRVLDLCGERGAFCGRLLADLSADVIKVEPPQGDPSRRFPPFAQDGRGEWFSLYFAARNMNKRSITLNLEGEAGRALFLRLLASTDIVVEDARPGYYERLGLGYSQLAARFPRLIVTSITDYGQTGPYAGRPGSALTASAHGGLLFRSGHREGPPCAPPGDLAYYCAGVMATTATMIALRARGASGQGQHVDVAAVDAIAACDWVLPNYSLTRTVQPRSGPGPLYPIVRCRDGYVRILGAITPRQWAAFRQWLGDPEVLRGPEWEELTYRGANHDLLNLLVEEKTLQRTMTDLYEEGQRLGISVTPVYRIDQLLQDRQMRARRAFARVRQGAVDLGRAPRLPIRPSAVPTAALRPAPRLGQHNREVLRGELGLTRVEITRLQRLNVIAKGDSRQGQPQPTDSPGRGKP